MPRWAAYSAEGAASAAKAGGHGRSAGPSRDRAAAFTLLEVLLAVSIILMLLGGMFAFYHYAMTCRTMTQTTAQETQLARAVLNQMADDLSSVSALTGIIRTRATRRGFAIAGASSGPTPEGGLVGSADSVSFQSARYLPPSRFAEVKLSDEDSEGLRENRTPMYDVHEIRWYWSYDPETGTSNGLYRTSRPAVLPAVDEAESADDQGGSGVLSGGGGRGGPGAARPAADPDAAEDEPDEQDALDEEEDEEDEEEEPDPLRVTEHVSPEMQWVYLRYYDGAAWSDQYESGASGPTPMAVEITIGFTPLLTIEQIESGKTVTDRFAELFGEDAEEPLPPRSYQLVVYVPSAEMTGGGGVRMQRSR